MNTSFSNVERTIAHARTLAKAEGVCIEEEVCDDETYIVIQFWYAGPTGPCYLWDVTYTNGIPMCVYTQVSPTGRDSDYLPMSRAPWDGKLPRM